MSVAGPSIVRISGTNGSGKSTFIEAASGYLHPWEGSVLVDGSPAAHDPARRYRRVCRGAEALYPSMTVQDHLNFAARCTGSDPTESHQRAKAYGMAEWMDSPAQALSTGNRRKLWIVMCTTGEFGLVLLDEPFDGLDRQGIQVLHDEIDGWARDRSVLLVVHSLPVDISFTAEINLAGPESIRGVGQS